VLVPFAILSWDGLLHAFTEQARRPLQIESLGSSVLLAAHQLGFYDATVVSTHGSQNLSGDLPDALAAVQTVIQGLALVGVWLLFFRGPATATRLTAACAASVVVFVTFGKVLSPQFLIWLVPLVPLVLAWPAATVWILAAAAYVTTHLWFPTRYWDMVDLQPVGWLVLVRNLLLVALAVALVAALATPRPEPAAPRSA
jgi:hypothetical protein